MSFKLPEDIIPCYEEDKAKKFVEDLWGCAPTFICTIGNTETANTWISAAGRSRQYGLHPRGRCRTALFWEMQMH